jgi:hypothetical protein
VVTLTSADVGLIDTAPKDQFEVPLKLSEIGTLGAPLRELPLDCTSGEAVLPPLFKFHCVTCGPGTVTV